MGRGAWIGILLIALAPPASGLEPRPWDGHHPVVLVHGIWDTAAVFDRMAARLSSEGWSVYPVSLQPNDGSAPLEALADQLRRFIDAKLGTATRLDIVGFSMGGMVARYYAQRLGGLDRLLHLVTISTPHHGSGTAFLRSLPGVLELRPGSPFLDDLASDEGRLAQVSFTSIWSPFDMMIAPASSSRMPVGREVAIPVLWHAWMLNDDRTLEAVVEALNQPP